MTCNRRTPKSCCSECEGSDCITARDFWGHSSISTSGLAGGVTVYSGGSPVSWGGFTGGSTSIPGATPLACFFDFREEQFGGLAVGSYELGLSTPGSRRLLRLSSFFDYYPLATAGVSYRCEAGEAQYDLVFSVSYQVQFLSGGLTGLSGPTTDSVTIDDVVYAYNFSSIGGSTTYDIRASAVALNASVNSVSFPGPSGLTNPYDVLGILFGTGTLS